MHIARPSPGLAAAVPVTYLVFDLMHLDGQVLLREPYARRRAALDDLGLAGPQVGVPPSFPGAAPAVLAASLAHGLEGVLLKHLDSPYVPGRRSPLWLKIKNARTQDVVIGGWTPGRGHRTPLLGSLLLGVQGPAGLHYCGKVGTGFTQADLHDLTRALHVLEQPASPFASPSCRSSPGTRTGPGPCWPARSATPNGHSPGGSATPPGRACAPTPTPPASSANYRPAEPGWPATRRAGRVGGAVRVRSAKREAAAINGPVRRHSFTIAE